MEWLFTWQFIIGLSIGCFIGVFVMYLMARAGRNEREVQKEVVL